MSARTVVPTALFLALAMPALADGPTPDQMKIEADRAAAEVKQPPPAEPSSPTKETAAEELHWNRLVGDEPPISKVDPEARKGASGCARLTSDTPWGAQDPAAPQGGDRWNDSVRCIREGVRFPFHGADFAPDERASAPQWRHELGRSGVQVWGYDIGAFRLVYPTTPTEPARWSVVRADAPNQNYPRNEDFVVWGKPVHAMAAGTVVRCWRNAPDNLVPGILHDMRIARRISGAGNFVVLQDDEGVSTWYAHAQEGSIPEAICPNEAIMYATPNDESSLRAQDVQADVPPELRVRVEAGRLLFRVGNSGESTAPHLHVHAQSGDPEVATALAFSNGRYQPVTDDLPPTLDGDFWFSFAGQPLPPGPIAIWPE